MSSVRAPLAALASPFVAFALVGLHAHHRAETRRREQPAIDAVARVLPAADLSFAGSARHLRFPSLSEPGAAFSDMPGAPDLDPAGGAIAPPIDVYTDIETRPAPKPRSRPLGQAPQK